MSDDLFNDESLSKAELQLIDKIIGVLGLAKFCDVLWQKVHQAFNHTFHGTNIEYGFTHATPDPLALKYLEDRIFILSDKTQDKLRGDLRWEILEGMRNSESIDEIKRRLDGIFEGNTVNTERIARTETLNAMNAGRLEAYEASEVTHYKMWRAAINNKRTAADSKRLHGQIQELGDPFVDPKTGDAVMHPPNRPNCRCAMIPLRKLPENIVRKGGQMYASDEMVGKIEIDISSLQKTEKRVWVKPTSKRKGHYRKIKGAKTVDKDIDAEARTKKINKTITDYEMKIRDQDYESCGAVDANGDLIFTKDGERDRVNFNEEERIKCKGTVFTHNHPVGASFSAADIQWACQSEMKEMRVISAGKTYSMKLKDGSNFSPELWKSRILPNFKMVNHYVRDEFATKIYDGRMSIDEANDAHWDEVWSRVVNMHIPELEYSGVYR